MKVCKQCKENKLNDEFGEYPNSKKKATCIVCEKKYQKAYQEKRKAQADKAPDPLPVWSDKRIESHQRITNGDYIAPVTMEPVAIQPQGIESRMLSRAKSRASKKGLAFNLEVKDIHVPAICPVLRIPMLVGSGEMTDNSPSLDRNIPSLGYTKGNVTVISMRANRIKSDANSIELALVLAYTQKLEENVL